MRTVTAIDGAWLTEFAPEFFSVRSSDGHIPRMTADSSHRETYETNRHAQAPAPQTEHFIRRVPTPKKRKRRFGI